MPSSSKLQKAEQDEVQADKVLTKAQKGRSGGWSGCAPVRSPGVLSGHVSSAVLFLASLLLFLLQHGGFQRGSADVPPRSQEQVLFDFSKVALGAVWAGVMTSACCASMLGSIEPEGNECGWYAVEIMLDTSLGMYASLWILRTAVWSMKKIIGERKAQQVCAGKYRSKTGAFVKVVYAQQVMLWVLVISVSKLGVAALVLSQA
ncbi:unnamed protein product, partial [Prorocentrum cordatum]